MATTPDQHLLDELYRNLKGQPADNGYHKRATSILSDGQIMDLCRKAKNVAKFVSLFDEGNTSKYKTASEADIALIGILAFYTQDAEQLDRLFRRSALYRAKWERHDYRARTIDRVLDRLTETYRPQPGFNNDPSPEPETPIPGDNPLLQGRVLLAKGIAEGIDPPEELEPGILLKGRVHAIYSGAGTGKTFLMLWLVKRCLDRGQRVLVLDMENGRRIISERLEELGVDTAKVDNLLYYLPSPSLSMASEDIANYQNMLDEVRPDLVVFDSWINFLAAAGLSENENTDISKWAVAYTHPARDRGCAVLLLDHVPHEGNRHRGATRKKDEVDVMWHLIRTQPFNRDSVGEIALHLDKDREGWLPPSNKFSVGGGVVGLVFEHSAGTIQRDQNGLTDNAKKVLDILKTRSAEGARWKHLLQGVGGSKGNLTRALKELARGTFFRKKGNLYYVNTVVPKDGLFKPNTEGTTRYHKGTTVPLVPSTTPEGTSGTTPLKGGTAVPSAEPDVGTLYSEDFG